MPEQIQSTQNQDSKLYDLEERTLRFAAAILQFVKAVPQTMGNAEVARQLVRSSGSVGANYIEANEALSKKDFAMRVKICRKESKESRYWLSLIEPGEQDGEATRQALIDEATQLMKIFGAILEKSK